MSQWPIGTGDVNDFYKWIGSHLLTLAMSRIVCNGSIHERDCAVALLGQARVMRDQQHGTAKLAGELAQKLEYFAGGLAVQVAGGLVGQYQ